MALNPQVEALYNRESELIAAASGSIEDTLAAIMDQVVAEFERNRQFVVPSNSSIGLLVDALGIGWTSGVNLGVEQFENLAQKQLGPRALLEYINTYGPGRARQISETTARQLSQIVIRGQREGKTSPQIMRELVNKIPKLAAARAKIIAETEVHSAVQFGAYNAALRSGRTLVKRWNTVEDDRVRDFWQGSNFSHRMAEGQKKVLDNAFQIPHISGGTEALRFPGDPEGSAGNIINCRCAVTYEEA